jgi:hypothetical protein
MANPKLFKLLTVLNAASEAAEEEIDFESIVSNIHTEVDYYHKILERLKCEEVWIDTQIEELTKKRNKIKKNIKSFKEAIKNAMVFNEFPKVPGHEWKLSLRPKTYIQVNAEATHELWEKFPNIITAKVTYEWNKTKIKQELKKDDLELAKYATQIKDYDPVFKPYVKGIEE